VGGSHIGGRKRVGTGAVSELAQLFPHRGQPPGLATGDVLDDDEAGAELGDDAAVLEPETGAGSRKPSAKSS
jgi:hypothetical protein